jgi:hypothetical protein
MGKDENTAVFCVSEQRALAAAAADPASCAAVRRQDARRSFLGLEVVLDNLGQQRIRELAGMAWSSAGAETAGGRARSGM